MGTFFIFSRDLYGNCRQTVDYERLSRSAGKLYAHVLSQLFELVFRNAIQGVDYHPGALKYLQEQNVKIG